jgi:homoserine kinase
MTTWDNNWYNNPIDEESYLEMATFIYEHYDNVVRSLPPGGVDMLQKFLATGEVSLGFDLWIASTGILKNPEIGRQLVRWLTAEVEPAAAMDALE